MLIDTVNPTTRVTANEPTLKGPDWVKDAIFYQIFPDRFKDGNPANNPPNTDTWGAQPKNDNVFQGGDLEGVQQGLSHIRSLGMNALYLNPIFSSPSNHRYNTSDYDHVDDKLGGDKAFESLVDDLKASGTRLILDGVFNHTSNENKWFKDIERRGSESPYWSWYNVHRFPIKTWKDGNGVLRSNDYESWGKPEWGGPYATLPVLNSLNPAVMDTIVTGKDSIVRKWIRDGRIDGWRMDVADEVEPEVWQQVRKVAKQENPDAYLVGENWQDASSMVKGDQFDGATNYKYFQQPAVEFFAQKRISADEFASRLRNGYSKEARLGMLNILESHDTPRFITQANGDWYRARPAAIFQFTYQGAPNVYYGAELAMEGGKDPDSRRAFDWNLAQAADTKGVRPALISLQKEGVDKVERARQMTGLYRALAKTRTESNALRRGDFEVIETHNQDNTLAYRRWIEGDQKDVVVMLNNDTKGHDLQATVKAFAPDGTRYKDALSGNEAIVENGVLKLSNVDGNWGVILQREA